MPKRLNDVCVGSHLDDAKVLAVQQGMVNGLLSTKLGHLFKGLSDPSRIRIVSVLREGEISVYDIANLVAMTQSAVSHQLATLRDAGLVKSRKSGRQVFYSLQDDNIGRMFDLALRHGKEQEQ